MDNQEQQTLIGTGNIPGNTAPDSTAPRELLLSRIGVQPGAEHARGHYRPFFVSGIAVALSLGAVWGAWLLLQIAVSGSFSAVGIHQVNAHGHAQIFGWVGLFVMGFAYQMFPRFRGTRLAWPGLARVTLGLMLGGILLRAGGEAFLHHAPSLRYYASAGSILEIIAVLAFSAILLRTMVLARQPLKVYEAYILCALFWFVVQTFYSAIHFWALSGAPDTAARLTQIAVWQAPLRDIQIHGFAMLMILGVSHQIFDKMYHLPSPTPRRSLAVLVALNLAIAGEIVGSGAMRAWGPAFASVWYASVLLLFVAVVSLVSRWRLSGPVWRPDRSVKFVRAAYAWLLLSLVMLVLVPVYQFGILPRLAPESHAAQVGFSHAYHGAIRHAATVGFISMMILGVASKFVPVFNGINVRTLGPLWIPFVLLNTGCAIRVIFQVASDFGPLAFPVAGISGLLEVTAIALWSVHLLTLMLGRAAGAAVTAPRVRPGAGPGLGQNATEQTAPITTFKTNPLRRAPMSTITENNTVGELVAQQPSRSRIFEAFRIDYCCGGKRSLAEACEKKGIGVGDILHALKSADESAPIGDVPNPAAMPLDVLADHIVAHHHDYLRRELPRLVRMSEKVGKVHGEQDPRLVAVAEEVRVLAEDLMAHTYKEERILFPVIRSLACPGGLPAMPFGTLANPIRAMEAEHDEAGGGLDKIAELTDDYTPPEWACNTYQALLDGLHDLMLDLHVHIHKENSILFPKALEEEQRRRAAQPGNG